jgi:hypothetical protein
MQDMKDMTDVLGALRDTGTAPADAETVAADVARGQRALVRRRHRRITGIAAVAVVAAVAAGTAATAARSGQSSAVASGTATASARPGQLSGPGVAAAGQTTQVQLAAYHGPQPAGFTVATVPAGWKVVSSTTSVFVAVPPGAHTPKPVPGVIDLRGGISVMLQGASRLPADSAVTKVTVNGKAGSLGSTEDKQATWLIFPDGAGHSVLVQVPVELGLTDSQIVRFAEGVTVTQEAQASVG